MYAKGVRMSGGRSSKRNEAPSEFQTPSLFAARATKVYFPGGRFVYQASRRLPASIQSLSNPIKRYRKRTFFGATKLGAVNVIAKFPVPGLSTIPFRNGTVCESDVML